MDDLETLARRFHLEPGAAEAGRQAERAQDDAVETRAAELVGIARRMGIELSMDAARIRAAAELSAEGKGQDGQ